MERALRERREGADRLDLVAEELDPERLAARGREDVDEPAADGELSALLHPFDALVAGERKLLGETLDAGLLAGGELDPLGPLVGRRQQLRERGRGSADEPARSEDVERPCALADEVRRRLEAGVPADAAARQQRDLLVAEVPRRRLRGVPGVGVFREEGDERAAGAQVERGQQQRQPGLGDSRPCSDQVIRERAEALALGKLDGERMQCRPVHDERRNRAVPLVRVYSRGGWAKPPLP